MASEDADDKKDPQFIVSNGIIYNKRDMMKLLWDLGHVVYFEIAKEKILDKGKGFIMQVSANSEDPTLFLGGRIYINVNSFDCLRVRKIKDSLTIFELHSKDHLIKIVPDLKKQQYPPYRYSAEPFIGLGIMGDGEVPLDNVDESSELPPDEWLN